MEAPSRAIHRKHTLSLTTQTKMSKPCGDVLNDGTCGVCLEQMRPPSVVFTPPSGGPPTSSTGAPPPELGGPALPEIAGGGGGLTGAAPLEDVGGVAQAR
jgi:hypothetical protein